uniref:Putative endoplasmic reticulum-based factor for assembly of v-atpase n=1 Tax=Corethrella appendiculata TaxID=1370023 RepID=U5ERK7_9DIPT
MLKLPIKDPSIKIIPTSELCDFVATLCDEKQMPENVAQIYKKKNKLKNNVKIEEFSEEITVPQLTDSERKLLKEMKAKECGKSDEPKKKKQKSKLCKEFCLTLNDLKWLNEILVKMRENDDEFKTYLHELIKDSQIVLPENEMQERNPELEARCQRLRKEQETREYEAMTKNVDSVRKHMPEETISYQMKQINRHIIAILQFLFSVVAGFAFGFIGIELIIGQLDFGFRLLLGIMIALTVALAEIYFLAKKLNEEYELPPVQTNKSSPQKTPVKLHKD